MVPGLSMPMPIGFDLLAGGVFPHRSTARRGPRQTTFRKPATAKRGADVNELTDEQLVEAHRSGDRAAMRTLIERYHNDLYRFLYRLLGNSASAEDVFQDAFLQVHLSAETFDVTRRFKPWLYTIAANKARDLMRRRARRFALDLSAPVGDDSGTTFVDLLAIETDPPDKALDDRERSNLVQEALNAMPVMLREILLLAYFQRLSYAQIAEDLEIPLGTVKSRLHSAVANFAKRWQEVLAKYDSESEHAVNQKEER
ncbi:MAG: sigma-70 family RNA polymerase sigma factor [Phycisphaeraceae bacterium]|nr:sigma-70 family RNA polymerase sigma factor [Phycisphaerales bacterium]MCB9860946.1 sigma-70 family RNA polymerase sigma factor [Phycisphaeraceae bacterium]